MELGVFIRTRLQHMRNARRSPAEIKALQKRKFLRLVAHAQAHSPFYRDLIAERGINVADCAPSDFPPLTKRELMVNFDWIVTDPRITAAGIEAFLMASKNPTDRFLGEYVVVHSSGSSGDVGYYVYSAADWAVGAALGTRIWPFAWRRRRMAFYGVTRGHFSGVSHFSTAKGGLASLRFVFASFDVNDPIARTIDGLNRFQPDTLSGYPNELSRLAEAQEAGKLRISPGFIAYGGYAMTPESRALVKRAFPRTTLLNHYGSSEHMTMGVGREAWGGIYLFEDEFVFEFGEGRALITSLFNRTLPLIRYVLEDALEPLEDLAPAYPFAKIRDLGGRARANPVFVNRHGEEDFISTSTFVEFFVPDVEQSQLHVLDKTACVLQVRLKDGLTEDRRRTALDLAERRLSEILAEKEMENVSRRIEVVEQFPPGKFYVVVTPETATRPAFME